MFKFENDENASPTSFFGINDKRLNRNSFWGGSSKAYDYVAAPLMTTGATLLYLWLAAYVGNQPAPVLFVIPIVLSAL